MKSGDPQWDLLGINGIGRLPALQWRLANIRTMAPKKRGDALDKLRRVLGV